MVTPMPKLEYVRAVDLGIIIYIYGGAWSIVARKLHRHAHIFPPANFTPKSLKFAQPIDKQIPCGTLLYLLPLSAAFK